jgi:hypothetical protein
MKPKAKTILSVLLLPCAGLAGDWRDGDAPLKPKPSHAKQVAVSWQVVPNVQSACEAESKRRGLGGFGYGVEACSFWLGSNCTIVTSQAPTQHQLGHELLHCFDHHWHP